ncbi:hypothetical protein GCM10022289_45200 [Pedobacter jeongneungensis]|uniref:Uncharacterized protein n=1 Tax=Pedobacter jeongneungensis TaxID=947309 RepID=A0ABP8BQ30_9SPHI
MKNFNLKGRHPLIPNFLILIFLFLLCQAILLGSCKKTEPAPLSGQEKQELLSLTIEEATQFLKNSIATAKHTPTDTTNHFLAKLNPDYTKIYHRKNSGTDSWNLVLKGSPSYLGQKIGYRKLRIFRDSTTKRISAEIIEVLPDPIALQLGKIKNQQSFTGKIYRYDLGYNFKGGSILSQGKTVGEIRPGPAPTQNLILDKPGTMKGSSPKDPLMFITESCGWTQDWYIDSEGGLNIHSLMSCSYSFYQDMMWSISDDFGGGGGGGDYYYEYGNGGSGGTGPVNPTVPEPSNLPMEDAKPVNPKEMTDCFSAITTPNAAFTVRVLVSEAFAGTSFNVGPNSFGHVAIQLSKTGNGQTITQTMGLYPTGTGLAKLESRGQILDNGDMEYGICATYAVNSETFTKLINYLSGERKDYHFTDFNCASYVYQAGQSAGINIPNPLTSVGLSGPGGASFADTPSGMAAALRE